MIAEPTKDRGAVGNGALASMRKRFELLSPVLDERGQRWWGGSEALVYGRGGVVLVHEATGMSRLTISAGIREIAAQAASGAEPERRLRRSGGGRKRLVEKQPGLVEALDALVNPATRGDPMSPLMWTSKSVRHLARELVAQGYTISVDSVSALLNERGYSLQGTLKTLEGRQHPDRDAQFQHIAAQSAEFMAAGQPVVSLDTKKKELVGPFRNGGKEYQPKGCPEKVRVHDFKDPELGKAIPYGIYDLSRNTGWVNVGIDHDTAAFAVESTRRWWLSMGAEAYPEAKRLMITADCGGSNGYRTRAWKYELQRFADESRLEITVCHFPPGTSKWNKVEHRLFCHITLNWRGRPLTNHETIVNLIGGTTTSKGLRVQAVLDTGTYPLGIKPSKQEMAALALKPAEFHGEWNYTFLPRLPLADVTPNVTVGNIVG